jgi:phosphoenolpyruvate carboxykinase (ATP)
LAEKIRKHNTRVWLVNTGWTGGAYGVGKRIKLAHTRAIIDAIHSGTLAKVKTVPDPFFGFKVVPECLGVPGEVLVPRSAWTDKAAYDSTAKRLFELFQDNFKKYEGGIRATVVADAAA